ncbi:MAG: beta-galactosidase small subunit family protein, partial [Peptostreptococcaceae bacterium]
IFADGNITPKIYEIKYWYANALFSDIEVGKVNIKNDYLFTNLNRYELKVTTTNNGVVISNKIEQLDVKAGESIEFNYDVPQKRMDKDEYIVTLSLVEKEDTLYASKGHEVAYHQVILPSNEFSIDMIVQNEQVNVENNETSIVLSAGTVIVEISKATGLISQYKANEESILKEENRPYFWRATTNNDRGFKNNESAITWRNPKNKLIGLVIEQYGTLAKVSSKLILDNGTEVKYNYYLDGKSKFKVEQIVTPRRELPWLPAISDMMILNNEYKYITYYGRGPIENYWDKYSCAKIGLYNDEVKEERVPYLQPQENGAKTDVRYLEIKNNKGNGIIIKGEPTIEFNISKYHPEDVEVATHFHELKSYDGVVLRLLYKQMGVAGDDSWQAKPHQEYILYPNRTYTFSYTIELNCK